MAGSSQGNQGGGTVITGVQPPQKPLNLLNAVGEIQQWGSIEKHMEEQLDSNYFTTQNRIDFFTIGIKNALTHLLFTLIFTPLSVGVLDDLIHIFGDKQLTVIDEIYAVFLMFSVSIGFAIFLSTLKSCYVGTVSKLMIKNLFQGLLTGEIFKIIVAFIVYQIIYNQMSPEHITKFLLFLHKYMGSLMAKLHFNYLKAFYWLLNFREVFPVSMLFILIGSVILAGVPTAVIFITYRRNKNRKVSDGL